jgi:hypothetical protein
MIFLLLTISPFLVCSSSLHGRNIGKCTDNQVELTRHDDIHFVAIGDWGSGHHHQEEVAAAIGDFCFWHRCDFIVSTGDNMYTTGVDSPFDQKFDEKWKDVYTHPSIAHLPWYMTVGNHDHSLNREWHQVEYSALEPRWKLPCLTHSFNVSTKATSATFVSIDTVSIEDNKNGALGMKELLDNELAKAGSDAWKVVFGHYPCHSGGHYGGSEEIQEQVLPIMKAHNVDFYLTGHDHNLQHWTTRGNPSGIDHIITGAGGESEYKKSDHNVRKNEAMGMDLEYFNHHYGFSYFSISNTDITVKFVSADGNTIYQYTRNKH